MDYSANSAWKGHENFAVWLVNEVQPQVTVLTSSGIPPQLPNNPNQQTMNIGGVQIPMNFGGQAPQIIKLDPDAAPPVGARQISGTPIDPNQQQSASQNVPVAAQQQVISQPAPQAQAAPKTQAIPVTSQKLSPVQIEQEEQEGPEEIIEEYIYE
jgi:hypothetical protein